MLKENNRDILLFRSKFLKQREYWKQKLSGQYNSTDFFLGYAHEPEGEGDERRIDISPGDESGSRILTLSKHSDLSIHILLLSALKALIFRYTHNEDIVVLSPVNKLKVKDETLNTLLFIRDRVDNRMTFKELVLGVRQSVLEAQENQDYPYDKLLEYLFPSQAEQDNPVLSTILCSFENIHEDNCGEVPRFSFRFLRTGEQIGGYLSYDSKTCRYSEAAQISRHFVQLLTGLIENVDVKIADVSFLTEEEKKQLLIDFNGKNAAFSHQRTIYQLIEDRAEIKPDAVAAVFTDRQITYRHLNRRADRLAALLHESGIGEDRPTVIFMDRSPLMVECILAAWKVGGAYIPVDLLSPPQRIREILEDSRAGVLMTTEEQVDTLMQPFYNGRIIKLDNTHCPELTAQGTCPEISGNMNRLAYIIYTSGSTGKPKGVMVEHMGMMNHIQAKINDLQLSDRSIVVQNSSHTFDISVWQFFVGLTMGGKTVIYPDELVYEPDKFITRLVQDQVTILEVVPSYLSVMLDFFDLNFRPLTSLRYLLVTGETVNPRLVKQWFVKFPEIKMVNAYGPTEASDDITHFIMTEAPASDSVPIGSPIQNLNIYIVDNRMNLCPIGVSGEIWVSGVGVGRGYLNEGAKTRQAYIRDPFINTTEPEKRKLYKTGDLGRWLTNGTIEFFGRKDYQVKIRGYRIELGEIETQLTAHPRIKDAAVIVKAAVENDGSRQDDNYLCAYLTAVKGQKWDARTTREFLAERLPDYMVPDHFVELEQLPLTPNGKIDRKALAGMETALSTEQAYKPPQNQVEETLVDIWAEVLRKEKDVIGVDSNFFRMGGHSLRATTMVAKIHKQLGVKIPLVEIFQTPTIEGIAAVINAAKWAENKKTTVDQEREEVTL